MGSLPGVRTYSDPNPGERSTFRSSFFQPEGSVGAHILESQVVDLNLVNWTVDAITKFDQKFYGNIQVSSPYAHYNRGEGLYVMPDIGAKCHVCIPSDGPPPFVLDFIMPMETIDGASEDAPFGTDGGKGGVLQEATAASFAGGRRRAKPGDIGITNRDGSFIHLHRGGVLQIGSTELAQRIFIPLQNLISDICQNYEMQNTGGSINWFIAHGESETNPPTVCRHTYRLLANDAKASVRVAIGKLSDVVTEPDEQTRSDLSQLGFGGTNQPTVCEVIVAPDAISPEDGSMTPDTRKASVLRYFFDKGGNTLFRTNGNILIRSQKKIRIRAVSDIDISSEGNLTMSFDGTGSIQVKSGLDINGGVTRINGGTSPVARVGSTVNVVLGPPLTLQLLLPGTGPTGVPVPVMLPVVTTGIVATGNPTILT